MANYFEDLNSINVNDKTENKGGLTYLSWAWAWAELKKKHPDATYTIYENDRGWNYHTDGRYAWVKTSVTVDGIEHVDMLPVMDYKNKSIPVDRLTSFDVNKTIQRSITKAIARHGLGLYIYAGEDLPDEKDGLASDRKSITAKEVKEVVEEEKQANVNMQKKISKTEVNTVIDMCDQKRVAVDTVLKEYGIGIIEDMTKAQYGDFMKRIIL